VLARQRKNDRGGLGVSAGLRGSQNRRFSRVPVVLLGQFRTHLSCASLYGAADLALAVSGTMDKLQTGTLQRRQREQERRSTGDAVAPGTCDIPASARGSVCGALIAHRSSARCASGAWLCFIRCEHEQWRWQHCRRHSRNLQEKTYRVWYRVRTASPPARSGGSHWLRLYAAELAPLPAGSNSSAQSLVKRLRCWGSVREPRYGTA